jgi:DNA-directed RNA polymerase subunit RPC12/RpoP
LSKLKIFRLCNHCNKEFLLRESSNKITITNFMNCPHCGKRNDVWVRINQFSEFKENEKK